MTAARKTFSSARRALARGRTGVPDSPVEKDVALRIAPCASLGRRRPHPALSPVPPSTKKHLFFCVTSGFVRTRGSLNGNATGCSPGSTSACHACVMDPAYPHPACTMTMRLVAIVVFGCGIQHVFIRCQHCGAQAFPADRPLSMPWRGVAKTSPHADSFRHRWPAPPRAFQRAPRCAVRHYFFRLTPLPCRPPWLRAGAFPLASAN